MKKLLSLALTAALALSVLTACGSKTDDSSDKDSGNDAQTAAISGISKRNCRISLQIDSGRPQKAAERYALPQITILPLFQPNTSYSRAMNANSAARPTRTRT